MKILKLENTNEFTPGVMKRFFLGEDGTELPATKGDILISQIREPHGVRTTIKMRLLVTIAPPI